MRSTEKISINEISTEYGLHTKHSKYLASEYSVIEFPLGWLYFVGLPTTEFERELTLKLIFNSRNLYKSRAEAIAAAHNEIDYQVWAAA